MAGKRVFVAFAIEDKSQRDLLRGQGLNTDTPFQYTDMSVKQPFDSQWKTQVRERIRGCSGLIALISSSTTKADGQRWEVKCAVEEKKPILAIWAYSTDRGGSEGIGLTAYPWTWQRIGNFIDAL